jgi:hypothetical protein
MGFGEMGNWDIEKFLLAMKLIKVFFLKINTPIFHYPMPACHCEARAGRY